MTEIQYFEELERIWPVMSADKVTAADLEFVQPAVKEALELVERGLGEFPGSAELWCAKGDLILLIDGHPVESARECYEKALKCEPENPRPYWLLGEYFDCAKDEPAAALASYRRAIELGGGIEAYLGLAQSLAQLVERDEALLLLTAERCPFAGRGEVEALIGEIREGVWDPVK